MSEDPARYDAGPPDDPQVGTLSATEWHTAIQTHRGPSQQLASDMQVLRLIVEWGQTQQYTQERQILAGTIRNLWALLDMGDLLRNDYREQLDALQAPTLDSPSPDALGRVVRDAWVAWARTQPNPKPGWLLPYDALDAADQEADRQIGAAVWFYTHAWMTSPAHVTELETALATQAQGYNGVIAELRARALMAEAALPSCAWCERQTGARVPILPGHTCVRPAARPFNEGVTT